MSVVQEYIVQFEKLCQPRTRALILAIILTSVAVAGFQSVSFNPGDGFFHLFPLLGRRNLPSPSPPGVEDVAEVPLSSDSENPAFQSHEVENGEVPLSGKRDKLDHEMNRIGRESDDFGIDGDGEQGDESSIDLPDGLSLKRIMDQEGKNSLGGMVGGPRRGFVSAPHDEGETNSSLEFDQVKHLDNNSLTPSFLPDPERSHIIKETHEEEYKNSSDLVVNVMQNNSSAGQRKIETLARSDDSVSQNGKTVTNCRAANDHATKKKVKQAPMTMSDLNRLVSKNRASSSSMVPQWSSAIDLQILDAKKRILNAPMINSDPELYPAIFRNISMFKRSYELMEKTLKVYVYKEGEKPIFHQPELTGIYSSEGWFMKHMEGSRHFVVEDPGKAHLFYIPFSSRLLQSQLYVPGSHSHENLIEHLKKYVDTIAAKYPFWNRTCGADHFVAACHDWRQHLRQWISPQATHETGRAMGASIRALCNADVTEDFELGKDVSLPETYVRNRDNPLRNLGGKSPRKRPILAFFAGQMHGYLRPVLLQHWENKDADMKIFGPLPGGGKKKGAYVQYMKSSRYCICARGYEVNSPRVVEAILYECVPVIISDNFVPPFFEVLNWEAFSVVLPERDVPRLKEILLSIPTKRYLRLYMGVKRVQQHFLWHREPVKYDLFHMILHSVWFNRVFQLRVS
ncbi:hypothetical protein Taro_011523 [Colocasia esculenta]|uniref:Exostosin GT47 domain-containing protein n=1 Tax=Colocasia esculenta TaxID=4460 RepID=A0A843U668_COLES|nr:hypothetical protein [Colocasia esculenta]